MAVLTQDDRKAVVEDEEYQVPKKGEKELEELWARRFDEARRKHNVRVAFRPLFTKKKVK